MNEPIQFGTDGIRGISGIYPLSPTALLTIGRAIGKWLAKTSSNPAVLLGRDTRPSSSHIIYALMAGLTAEGVSADHLEVITTPGVAHLTRALNYSLGIVVSASHNPAEQNGIKLLGADGFKLSDDDETEIEAVIAATFEQVTPTTSFGQGRRVCVYRKLYSQHLLAMHPIHALKGLSVVLDCANGAAYELGPKAFSQLGAKVTAIGASPTGDNINVRSGSEHVRRHSANLLATMQANHADLGVAFDGDADRVIFLTPEGAIVDGDHVLGLLATHLHDQGLLPGNTVVATDMSNSGLEHYLRQHDIKLERVKVGDRYVMARMREKGLRLGGEQSGHIILLDDDHTAGDGIYIGLQVAALVAQDKSALTRIVTEAPKFPQMIASAHLDRRVPLEAVEKLQPLVEDTLAAFQHQGRVNLRYSGTEPNLLRVMVEGGMSTTEHEVIERVLALCHLVAEASETNQPIIDIVDSATGAKIETGGQ